MVSVMKNFFNPLPDLDERLDRVEDQVRQARRRLERQVEEALIPLDIQEDFTISELEGDVMLVSRNDDLHEKVRNLIRSEGYGCDIPERTSEAIGLLKLRKYQMVIADYTRRSRGRLFEYVRRYQPHVKIVSIVRNNDEGRRVMRAGSYSYLLGRGFDPEQDDLLRRLVERFEIALRWSLPGERPGKIVRDGELLDVVEKCP